MVQPFRLNNPGIYGPEMSAPLMGFDLPFGMDQDTLIKWVVVPGATVAALSLAGALFFKKRKARRSRRRR